ncbi:sarcosine oxidase subunit delta [Acidiphilium sp. PA]|uniref:sarcosine oxidase subunit delta n=1 Tax=Acidiphilium sp. PA TaxID=2871705 RepID=UPI002244E088|nr:sarcosine oxidase subunit delta [Acidiphilium sp. PA]MCW8307994.1 sarcosine oxidase subunit delta [Acidiphilium sp. PA]
MLLIPCPYCGERPEIEFSYGGEAHVVRAPANATDAEWTAFLYQRSNARGSYAERWRHAHGCGRFFNARRNTVTDFFEQTYKIGEVPA